MKQNIITLGLIILLLIGAFFGGRSYEKRNSQIVIVRDTITVTIEKIMAKNDSLMKVNDSINFKVIEIEKVYETTVDDIIRNNPYDDYSFFSTYIERYNTERYCGRNYPDTAQNCEYDIRGARKVD